MSKPNEHPQIHFHSNLKNHPLGEKSYSLPTEIKGSTLKNLLGLVLGCFAKKMIFENSQKLLQKNTRAVLKVAVAMVVLKNSDKIIAKAEDLLQYTFQYFKKKNKTH